MPPAYVVEVTETARAENQAVRAYVAREGTPVAFPSRAAAERRVEAFTDAGETPVRLQRPSRDDREVDAYLVVAPDRRTREPSGSLEEGLTFDVGANLYGALGEALVVGRGRNPPALTYYVASTFDLDREAVDVVVVDDPEPYRAGDLEWRPDCTATVYPDGRTTPLATLYCEVKTGGGSLERGQERAMARKAASAPVLLISVDVDALPDRYTVEITEVDPADAGDADPDGEVARLDDFRD